MSRADASPDDAMLVQSRALGDPTRHSIFVYLRDAEAPVGVAELTEHFGLNHNAIRQHLSHLVEAGLVLSELGPPAGPGRPPRLYRTTADASERWGGPSPYEELSMMLLELLSSGRSPREVGREAGRRLAATHGVSEGAIEVLDAVARRMGFEPRVKRTSTGVELVLDRCPFVGPAEAAPEVVCSLHRGLAEGIAEHAPDEAIVDDVVRRPPRDAGCRIKVDQTD